jgi:hypothetical protein
VQNPLSAGNQAPGVAESGSAEIATPLEANSGPEEMMATHE